MSLGNGNPREGDKGSNFDFERSSLKLLQAIATQTSGGLGAPAVTTQEVGGTLAAGIAGSSILALSCQTDGKIAGGFADSSQTTLTNVNNSECYITDIANNFSGVINFELALIADTVSRNAFVNVFIGSGDLKDNETTVVFSNTFDTNNFVLSQTTNGLATISGTITVPVSFNNPCFIIGLRNSNAQAACTGAIYVTGRITFAHGDVITELVAAAPKGK